jgi:hypothetical protein
VVEEVATIEIYFYSSGGWESNGLERVACGGHADSML